MVDKDDLMLVIERVGQPAPPPAGNKADVNGDGVVSATDVAIVLSDYLSGETSMLLAGYVPEDPAAGGGVDRLTSWNQIFPDAPLTGGQSCECGGGRGSGFGTGCDAQIINCPGTARVGEEIVIAGGGGLGETCRWSVSGDAPILIQENGGVFRFRGLGPGTVTVPGPGLNLSVGPMPRCRGCPGEPGRAA